jgi:hypothetical protein
MNQEPILADKPANLFRGLEGVGGRLKITSQRLIFIPHAFNIQTQPEEIFIWEIQRIDRKKSLFFIPNQMVVVMKSGAEFRFVVNGREELIALIEKQK